MTHISRSYVGKLEAALGSRGSPECPALFRVLPLALSAELGTRSHSGFRSGEEEHSADSVEVSDPEGGHSCCHLLEGKFIGEGASHFTFRSLVLLTTRLSL